MSYFNGKRRMLKGAGAFGVLAAFVLGTAGSAYAGIGTAQSGYVSRYEAAAVQDGQQTSQTDDIEYTEATTELPYAIMDLNPRARVTTLGWTVLADNRLESQAIYIQSGQTLTMGGVASPSSVSFKYGYTDRETDHYCIASGNYGHEFVVAETGNYYLFVRNLSWSKNLDISVSYHVE